jgi:long-chain fatty acid transport protein
MKKRLSLILTVALMFALQSIVFSNGLSLNSIGTKALGMGGAFVGLANDATALYWNPAGLATQGSSIYVFSTDVIPLGTYKYDMAGIDAKQKTNNYISPNAFINYRMNDWAFSFGIYVPAGLGAEWEGKDVINLTAVDFNGDGVPDKVFGPYEWMSKIAVINFSPAVAYNVNDQLAVGVALNVYYGMFDLKRPHDTPLDVTGDRIPDILPQYTETSDGIGLGATIGLKYKVNEMLSLGATYRTSTKVKMSGTGELEGLPMEMKSDFDRDVTWPMWFAGGIAVQPTECMTLTFDAQYSNWKALDKLTAKYSDWNSESTFTLDWDNAVQIRAGLEYAASKELAFRLGYYYDPAPAPDETVNFLFPSSTNHTATGGLSYKINNIQIDASLEYLFGAERDITYSGDNMPGLHQMDIFAFSIGLGYSL